MDEANRIRDKLIALLLLGCVLLLPPVLLVFNRPLLVLGIPPLYLYLFAAWAVMIALAAAIAVRIPGDEGNSPDGVAGGTPPGGEDNA